MRAYFCDETGATAIEYGLIASIMAVGVLTAMQFITDGLISDANKIANILK
jgi:Flp pilus assembly pilin Flp